MIEIDSSSIQAAAEHALSRSRSTHFGEGTLSDTDISCIAEAIAAAITDYDKQRSNS